MIQSLWNIKPWTAPPVVLLDYGDMMEAELELAVNLPSEVVTIPYAQWPFLRDMGNRTFTLSFAVVRNLSTDAAMRMAMMDSTYFVAGAGKQQLTVEAAGVTARYWKFTQALITAHKPAPVVTRAGARVRLGYDITATGMSLQPY